MKIWSFPPIADAESCILILGTMPSKESLRQNEYYANIRNAFWKLMFNLLGHQYTTDYKTKVQLLLNSKIAIWDVLKVCERESSADNDIMKEEANDLKSFIETHPSIKHLFFNGQAALSYFERYIKDVGLPGYLLPSTSSAHAIPYLSKLESWSIIKPLLNKNI